MQTWSSFSITENTAMNVDGKKAIVFGGTSGIGLATTRQLAALGAKVVAVSRDPRKAGTPPAGVKPAEGDGLDRAALETLFKQHAPFDVLISASTGGTRAMGPF